MKNLPKSVSNSQLTVQPMTSIERERAIEITNKIKKIPIASFFLKPVDPVKDGLPNYLIKIKPSYPMDLGTVSTKLEKSQYTTIEDWKKDMETIWKNAMTYNPVESPYYAVASELQQIFRRKSNFVPKVEADLWIHNLQKLNKKFKLYSNYKLMVANPPQIKQTTVKKG